jgi:superfamily II DNA or RNA helicase
VIVDEFHRGEAPTYRRLLEHLKPKELLGLTATPERSDGESVVKWFDGRIAAELRLWEALERGFLSPFQYFGVHDGVDLSSVRWTRGGYDLADLEKLYTGSDVRVSLILKGPAGSRSRRRKDAGARAHRQGRLGATPPALGAGRAF